LLGPVEGRSAASAEYVVGVTSADGRSWSAYKPLDYRSSGTPGRPSGYIAAGAKVECWPQASTSSRAAFVRTAFGVGSLTCRVSLLHLAAEHELGGAARPAGCRAPSPGTSASKEMTRGFKSAPYELAV
jgi:hypothetical protein